MQGVSFPNAAGFPDKKRFSPLLREANQSRLILFSHTDGRDEKPKPANEFPHTFAFVRYFLQECKTRQT